MVTITLFETLKQGVNKKLAKRCKGLLTGSEITTTAGTFRIAFPTNIAQWTDKAAKASDQGSGAHDILDMQRNFRDSNVVCSPARRTTSTGSPPMNIAQSNCAWDVVSAYPKYRKPFNILAEGLSSANWLPS
jgi:hypothetical protein